MKSWTRRRVAQRNPVLAFAATAGEAVITPLMLCWLYRALRARAQ